MASWCWLVVKTGGNRPRPSKESLGELYFQEETKDPRILMILAPMFLLQAFYESSTLLKKSLNPRGKIESIYWRKMSSLSLGARERFVLTSQSSKDLQRQTDSIYAKGIKLNPRETSLSKSNASEFCHWRSVKVHSVLSDKYNSCRWGISDLGSKQTMNLSLIWMTSKKS